MSRSEETKAPPETVSEDWALLPWRKREQHAYRLQKRIYRASETAQDGSNQARTSPGIDDNDHLIEEPDAVKVARPVL